MPPDALWVGNASAVSESWVLLDTVDLPRHLVVPLACIHFHFFGEKRPGSPFFSHPRREYVGRSDAYMRFFYLAKIVWVHFQELGGPSS